MPQPAYKKLLHINWSIHNCSFCNSGNSWGQMWQKPSGFSSSSISVPFCQLSIADIFCRSLLHYHQFRGPLNMKYTVCSRSVGNSTPEFCWFPHGNGKVIPASQTSVCSWKFLEEPTSLVSLKSGKAEWFTKHVYPLLWLGGSSTLRILETKGFSDLLYHNGGGSLSGF